MSNGNFDPLDDHLKALRGEIDKLRAKYNALVNRIISVECTTDLWTPAYGYEFVADLHEVRPITMTREVIAEFFNRVGKLLNVELRTRHFWDDESDPGEAPTTNPNHAGVTAVQFLLASNITVHTLPKLGAVYVNVFTCGAWDNNGDRTAGDLESLCRSHWRTRNCRCLTVDRLLNPSQNFTDEGERIAPRRRTSLLEQSQ